MAHKTRDVELSVEERYALARLQPTKGDFVKMTMTKNLITLLELKAEEAEAWGYVAEGRGRWAPKDAKSMATEHRSMVTFNEVQFSTIAAQLEEASKAGALEVIHLTPYELFVRKADRDDEEAALREIHAVPDAEEA